jgi:hypothetical protein
MKTRPVIVYRDIAISYSDWDNKFSADGEYGSDSLEKICERIDKQLATGFTHVPVFWEDRRSVSTGIATSITDDNYVWISHPEKKGKYGYREKQRGPVYPDTPENRDLYAVVLELQKELDGIVEDFRKKANAVKEKMTKIGGRIEAEATQ